MKKSMKRTAMRTCAAVVSLAVMGGTALVSANNVSGYERLKQATIATVLDSNNYTGVVDVTVILDGEEIFSASGMAKQESAHRKHSRHNGRFMDEQHTTDIHEYDGETYYYNSDDDSYTHWPWPNASMRRWQVEKEEPRLTDSEIRLFSAMIDIASGDTKNFFTQDGDQIALTLGRNQIPEVVQLGLAVLIEQANMQIADFKDSHPEYINPQDEIFSKFNDLSVESVAVDALLSPAGHVENFVGRIALIGYNVDGGRHTLVTEFSLSITDIGSTVVLPFDTTGKTINNSDTETLNELDGLLVELDELRELLESMEAAEMLEATETP